MTLTKAFDEHSPYPQIRVDSGSATPPPDARAVNQREQANNIQQLIKRYVPAANLLSNVGSEIAFGLPLEASSTFPTLLRELDKQLPSLGLVNYGLSVTTLEEVFLKVAQEDSVPSMSRKNSLVERSAVITARPDAAAQLEEGECAGGLGSVEQGSDKHGTGDERESKGEIEEE